MTMVWLVVSIEGSSFNLSLASLRVFSSGSIRLITDENRP